MRTLLAGLLLLLASAAASEPERALNDEVIAFLTGYPLDGRYPYGWVPDRHTDGVSQPLSWQGTVLGQPDEARAVHCSGITFEVYIQALSRALSQSRAPDIGPTAADLLALKEEWYIRQGTQTGPVSALVDRGMGVSVNAIEALQPGDFVQFWRNNGNGHSAIFIEHTRYRSGAVRGLVFWSAQGSSEGLGYRRVSIGERPEQISPGSLHGVRAVVPEQSVR